jgi:hypothetical protein
VLFITKAVVILPLLNEIICWHHSHIHKRHIKGVNILSCLVEYEGISLPVGYEIIHKDISFSDVATKKVKRKASIGKNEHFRNLIDTCSQNKNMEHRVLFSFRVQCVLIVVSQIVLECIVRKTSVFRCQYKILDFRPKNANILYEKHIRILK